MLEKLKYNRSAVFINEVAGKCAADEALFDVLMQICMSDDEEYVFRALWAAGHAVEKDKHIFKLKHHHILIDLCRRSKKGGIKRNCLRIWQFTDLPESVVAEITDICIGFLQGQNEDIAVRAFSITVLQNCLLSIPELSSELELILDRMKEDESPAIRVRVRKFHEFIQKHF